ncbi:hypothetical protein Lepto7375DRAFT_1403 [Leptolyngbya sp. PCC 7375]|nr:hypothetical protein Lepto7375DRAFT_1403 [Leptolyngbya sp. PCC 7375]
MEPNTPPQKEKPSETPKIGMGRTPQRSRPLQQTWARTRRLNQGTPRKFNQSTKQFETLSQKDKRIVQIKHAAFFEEPNWWKKLKSIDISSAGQKGGVIFIHTTIPGRSYAIKVTDAPQQVLFAEHLLLNLGKAKVPKSLVFSIGDNDVDKTANPLINFIKKRGTSEDIPQRIKYTLQAAIGNKEDLLKKSRDLPTIFVRKSDKSLHILIISKERQVVFDKNVGNNAGQIDLNQEVKQKLDVFLSDESLQEIEINDLAKQIIEAVSQDSKYEYQPKKRLKYENFIKDLDYESNYLVVMKLITGDSLSVASADLQKWSLKYYPSSNPIEILDEIRFSKNFDKIFYKKNKIERESYEALKKIISSIYVNRTILDNPNFMKNLGRVLAVDCLLGNADRFEKMNLGNAFFVYRKDGFLKAKESYPIGVIDNDSFLPVFMGQDKFHPDIEKRRNRKVDNIQSYVEWNVVFGYELDPKDDMKSVQTSDIKSLLENFHGNWFLKFRESFLSKHDSTLIQFIYTDDGTLIKQPKAYKPLSQDPQDQNWKEIEKNILIGFTEGLKNIRGNDFKSITDKYNQLFEDYGFTNNFDFIALDVRRHYMTQAVLGDSLNLFGIKFDHNQAVSAVIKQVFPPVEIPGLIRNSIQHCISNGLESRTIGSQLIKDLSEHSFREDIYTIIISAIHSLKLFGKKKTRNEHEEEFSSLFIYALLKNFNDNEKRFKGYKDSLAPKVYLGIFEERVKSWVNQLNLLFSVKPMPPLAVVSIVLKDLAEVSKIERVDIFLKLTKDSLANIIAPKLYPKSQKKLKK